MSEQVTDQPNDAGDDLAEGTEPAPKPAKTYTKAEVDAMVNKAKIATKKEFGDVLELRTKAEQFDQLQESSKSEEIKLRERADKAVRDRDAALTRATNTQIRSAIISAASRLGSVDPEAVAALVDRTELVVDGDEVLGVEEAVKALLAQKSYLRSNGASRAGAELTPGGTEPALITRSQIQQWARSGGLTAERQKQIEEAHKAGRIVANR